MESDLPLLYNEFQKAADKFPQSIAVIYNDGKEHAETVTYQKLVQEVLKVTQCLESVGLVMQSRQFVCLFMEPAICLPALIMGILSQNAAFICLDNRSTDKHRTEIFGELNISWVFTIKSQNILSLKNLNQIVELKQEINVHGIVVELWKIHGAEIKSTHSYKSTMAYAIMTSGTCGDPKCVRVPRGCITPNIMELRSILNICSNDIIFMASPLTFDPCIVELFLALTSGAAILIVSNAIKATPSVLIQVLFPKTSDIYSGITIMQCTPSVISRWPVDTLKHVVLGAGSSLKTLLLGGEPCPKIDDLKAWKSPNNQTNVYNIYGITEVSCWASLHKIDFLNPGPNGVIPLGVPLQETSLQVRDEAGAVLSDGLGELFIGSASRVCIIGKERDGHRTLPLYRATGDIVKIDKNRNEIIYSYRKDDVIKRWGHRVNLSEIENLAAQNDFVRSTHCIWDSKSKKLGLFINFLKSNEDFEKCISKIRLNLGENLTYFSIPDIFLHISEVPLTTHGKVNKRQLRTLMTEETDNEQKKLTQDFDHTVQTAFQDLCLKYLCCSSILPNESFLAQGGNSFLALAISNDLEKSGYAVPRTFILKLLDGSSFQECSQNLKSFPILRKDSDISIARMMHTHKREETVSEEVKDVKRSKRTNAEDDDLAAACCAGVHYSLCRGRIYKYETPVEVASFASKVNDLASIGLEIVWTVDLGKCVDASPLFVQYSSNKSRVVVGSHSHKLAIIEIGQTADSVQSQFVELNDRIESSACVSACGCFVFVGCYGGYIYCTDTQSGKIHWKFNTESSVKCSPTLCLNGSAIVVGSYNSILYCIRILDGKQLWSIQPGSSGIVSSPCVSEKNHLIFVGGLDGTCCSVNEKDAAVIWRTQLSSPIFSNPTMINGENQVLFAEVTGLVHCMSSLQGYKLWTFQASGNIFSAFSVFADEAKEDRIVFGCHDKKVYCLQPDNDNSIKLKWKSELDSAVYATPFVFAIKSTTGMSTNLIAAISTKGVIHLLDSATGTHHCRLALPGDVFSSPIVHQDKLIVGCRDNNVYGVKLSNGDALLGSSAMVVTGNEPGE